MSHRLLRVPKFIELIVAVFSCFLFDLYGSRFQKILLNFSVLLVFVVHITVLSFDVINDGLIGC